MAKKIATFDSIRVTQIIVALFLFTLGIVGIMHWNSGLAQFTRGVNRLFGGSNNPFNLIVAIIEMAAGVVVAGALFVSVKNRLIYILTLIVAILWVIEILIGFFFNDNAFKPDFVSWLNQLLANVIILIALWLINRKYV